jgi:hypothetical protein
VIELTKFTKARGGLTKKINLNPDGTINSDGNACAMGAGRAKRVHVDGLDGLAALIEGLKFNEAIALGVLRRDLPDVVPINAKGKIEDGTAAPGAVARSKENLVFEAGRPALILLDYDTKQMPPEVRQRVAAAGGFWPALVAAVPGLAGVPRLVRPSTTTGLRREDTGETFPGSDGLHTYIAAGDAADIPRCLKAMHDRLWLAGFGWYALGKAGQLLSRSLVDVAVGSSERLVFEGPPIVEPPLVQDAAARRPVVAS